MPTFRYRALTQVGEIVSGSLHAPNAAEVARRIEYLGLIPIEAVAEQSEARIKRRSQFSLFSRPRVEDVTIFTGDLALLLRTGARINDALELLAADPDLGRMRPTAAELAAALMSGESFGEAISRRPEVFPPVYVALARVGEASGTLVPILEALARNVSAPKRCVAACSTLCAIPPSCCWRPAACYCSSLLSCFPNLRMCFAISTRSWIRFWSCS